MIKTIIAVVILIGAVLFVPVWVQAVLFVATLFVVRQQLLLVVPAIVADVVYAPTISLTHLKMTTIALVLVGISYIIRTQTRLGESRITYVSIKK